MIADPLPGGWAPVGRKFLVRPPEGPSTLVCPMTRTIIRHPDETLTVLPFVESGGRRWRLVRGAWTEMT